MLLAWPFLVWFGLTMNGLHWLLPAMALLLVLRLRQARQKSGPMRFVMQSVALAGIVLCVASALLKTHQLLLFWPVIVNLVMLTVFGGSLWTAMPLVERLARLQDPNLPPEGVRYTRRVTQIWCAFFVLNGTMALFTAVHGDMRLWTAWNGMIAYLLMGTLMAGEWLVRRRVITREKQ
jgi:Predicted membrane protein